MNPFVPKSCRKEWKICTGFDCAIALFSRFAREISCMFRRSPI